MGPPKNLFLCSVKHEITTSIGLLCTIIMTVSYGGLHVIHKEKWRPHKVDAMMIYGNKYIFVWAILRRFEGLYLLMGVLSW